MRAAFWAHMTLLIIALDRMQAILQDRPFMLGDTPSIADYGLMGPMLRHFSQDAYQPKQRARALAGF